MLGHNYIYRALYILAEQTVVLGAGLITSKLAGKNAYSSRSSPGRCLCLILKIRNRECFLCFLINRKCKAVLVMPNSEATILRINFNFNSVSGFKLKN